MTQLWTIAFVCLYIGHELRPDKPVAIWGHGVNPQPIVWRSRLQMIVNYLKGTKKMRALGDTSKNPRYKLALLLILLTAGDIESNPGPPPGPGPDNRSQGNSKGGNEASAAGGVTTRLSSQSKQKQQLLSFYDGGPSLQDIMKELKATRCEMNQKIDALSIKLEDRYEELKSEITSLQTALEESKKETEQVKVKLEDLENRSRRNNLIIHGLGAEQSSGESWDETEVKVCEILKEKLDLDLDGTDFERVHRMGKATPSGRPVMAMCTNFKTKSRILKAARDQKPEGIYISEDLTQSVRDARTSLHTLKKKKSELGYTAFMSFNKLIVKSASGQKNVYVYNKETRSPVKIKSTFPDTTRVINTPEDDDFGIAAATSDALRPDIGLATEEWSEDHLPK